MQVTIETKARPCPGVERAIAMAEDALHRGENLIAVGELIHNSRELKRLSKLGLKVISAEEFVESAQIYRDYGFLVRAHGEAEDVIHKARELGVKIHDATCPIVKHSQDLVKQHVQEGWGIILAGKENHPEVRAIMAVSEGQGNLVTSREMAKTGDFEDRSLLLAQSTISPDLFHDIGKILTGRLSGLKIADTTCRFIRKRLADVKAFAEQQDVVIVLGGLNSSNCKLLYSSAQKVNDQTYRIEGPDSIDWKWFNNGVRVGITGGASTPKWQMEEMRSYLTNHEENNPKGLKNKKGGKFLWWMRKKQN